MQLGIAIGGVDFKRALGSPNVQVPAKMTHKVFALIVVFEVLDKSVKRSELQQLALCLLEIFLIDQVIK